MAAGLGRVQARLARRRPRAAAEPTRRGRQCDRGFGWWARAGYQRDFAGDYVGFYLVELQLPSITNAGMLTLFHFGE